MSAPLISFLASLSLAVWIYTKQMRRSGNNTRNSVIVAVIVGVVAFFFVWSILSLVLPK